MQFPNYANIQVYTRNNTINDTCAAGDFAAWDWLLSFIDRKKYKRFMFINDTVRGPFLDPLLYKAIGKVCSYLTLLLIFLAHFSPSIFSQSSCLSLFHYFSTLCRIFTSQIYLHNCFQMIQSQLARILTAEIIDIHTYNQWCG